MSNAIPNILARNTMAALLGDIGSSQSSAHALSAKAKSSDPAPSDSSTDPIDTLDLSERAKAMLERNKGDQVVADRLDELLAVSDGDDSAKAQTKSSDSKDKASKLFDAVFGTSTSDTASETTWEAGSKYGDASITDAAFREKYKSNLELHAERSDLPPESKQALQAAISSGTWKIQKASDVPDLNMHATTTYTDGEGGHGMSNDISLKPTGDIKAALDTGTAMALWTEDRGNVYITW